MKIIYFLILIGLFSCNQNSNEKKLNGNWYETSEILTILEFKPDTLTIYDPNPQKVKWKANNKIIEFNYTGFLYSIVTKKINLEYVILNDTLNTEFENQKRKYIKANTYTEFLSKKHQVKFQLPKNIKLNSFKDGEMHGLKIFVGKRSDKIIIKTEYSNNLDNLEQDFDKLKFGSMSQFKRRAHYRVFADKNISQSVLKSVYSKLRKSEIKRITRIYQPENHYNYRYEVIKEI